ncbi:MAG: TetR/AcrR family transcriptional regulator [Agathobacter sp.]|nr:TetR/AcrR family transcriptional regulator [Agathobacter sp.]
MNQTITDERFHVVEEAICDAFMQIITEKDLDKVTVSDVIKRAGIVRSTFYNHYENIPALISAMEDRSINDIFTLMETFSPRNDYEMCKSYFKTICEYTMTNPFIAKLLSQPHEDDFFEKAIRMFHRYVTSLAQTNARMNRHSNEEYTYMIACAIGGTIGILHKWTRENFQMPVEQIADILTQVFLAGILPLMT